MKFLKDFNNVLEECFPIIYDIFHDFNGMSIII